jgi:hypothetical protein
VRATRGADFVAIAGATVNPVYTLVFRPEVRSVQDLKGKTVALTLVDDAIRLSMRQLWQHSCSQPEVTSLRLRGAPT